MTDTKRVDELEVEDVVIFAGSKGSSTISSIETKVDEVDSRNLLFVIYTEETEKPLTYLGEAQVTYLCNNKKEKETMKNQKVDCSALYPYFDSLAGDEQNLKGSTNIPVYVRQQLKNIYELFEGVLELTLEEVKTLYFERKMSKSDEKTTPLVNRQELKSKVFYNGYELDVTTRLFILKKFYELDRESVPDSSTTYCGSCEEIGFNVYLATSVGSLVNKFKEAVDNYIQAKHPDTLM